MNAGTWAWSYQNTTGLSISFPGNSSPLGQQISAYKPVWDHFSWERSPCPWPWSVQSAHPPKGSADCFLPPGNCSLGSYHWQSFPAGNSGPWWPDGQDCLSSLLYSMVIPLWVMRRGSLERGLTMCLPLTLSLYTRPFDPKIPHIVLIILQGLLHVVNVPFWSDWDFDTLIIRAPWPFDLFMQLKQLIHSTLLRHFLTWSG